ncbi:MAG: ClpXP protease specificity-enhancing factor [Gammaproteobacteria bacterium]|nr:ClpXP protease specificity-enhancing factor [Gammaproteobacteria bacterium]
MTSNKPYLIRALYEWLVDNDATPHIMVNTTITDVMIPDGIDKDGQVVLNIAGRSVQELEMENTHIAFTARFGGIPHNIYIPIKAIMAIYSMEDGEGMMFAEDISAKEAPVEEVKTGNKKLEKKDAVKKPEKKKPGLKIVK